jgi:hypothetical protein
VKALDQSIDRGHKTYTHKLQLEQLKGSRARELDKTFNETLQQRSKLLTDELERKFSNRPIGIHGKELPKYAEHCPEWWRKHPNALETSQRRLLQTRLHG